MPSVEIAEYLEDSGHDRFYNLNQSLMRLGHGDGMATLTGAAEKHYLAEVS